MTKELLKCTWEGCNKMYTKPSRLREHMMSHTNERPFSCPEAGCSKAYRRKSHLNVHISSAHANNIENMGIDNDGNRQKRKVYHCEFSGCTSKFFIKYHLKRHQKLHDTPHPYICLVKDCQSSFRRHFQLHRHAALVHSNPLPYPCTICSQRFLYPSKLKRHILKAHSQTNQYICTMDGCMNSFSKWTLYRKHIRESHHGHNKNKNESCYHPPTNNKFPSLDTVVSYQNEKEDCKSAQDDITSSSYRFIAENDYSLNAELSQESSTSIPSQSDSISSTSNSSSANASLLFMLSGIQYYQDRHIRCTIASCPRRFFRFYDLQRHILSSHS